MPFQTSSLRRQSRVVQSRIQEVERRQTRRASSVVAAERRSCRDPKTGRRRHFADGTLSTPRPVVERIVVACEEEDQYERDIQRLPLLPFVAEPLPPTYKLLAVPQIDHRPAHRFPIASKEVHQRKDRCH